MSILEKPVPNPPWILEAFLEKNLSTLLCKEFISRSVWALASFPPNEEKTKQKTWVILPK
jgi:hypothetical protein